MDRSRIPTLIRLILVLTTLSSIGSAEVAIHDEDGDIHSDLYQHADAIQEKPGSDSGFLTAPSVAAEQICTQPAHRVAKSSSPEQVIIMVDPWATEQERAEIRTRQKALFPHVPIIIKERTGLVPPEEREALVALFEATDGPNWEHNQGWLGPPGTECGWYGVSCMPEHVLVSNGENAGELERVISLDLFRNRLKGRIPPKLDRLTYLRSLYLFGNDLYGVLPAEVATLPHLEELRVFDTKLSGDLPEELIGRWDSGKIRFQGYAQFVGVTKIQFETTPGGSICGASKATLLQSGEITLEARRCRNKHDRDRMTYLETKTGRLDSFTGDFDHLVRMLELEGFWTLEGSYSRMITHATHETLTAEKDGLVKAVEDYGEKAPPAFWRIKRAVAGVIENSWWETEEKSDWQER